MTPAPVKNARVLGDGDCIVEWDHHDDHAPNVLEYKVSYEEQCTKKLKHRKFCLYKFES